MKKLWLVSVLASFLVVGCQAGAPDDPNETSEGEAVDEAADEIRAEGPLVLTDPAGGVLLADAAALTPDLEDGLITSARLLIAGRMQLAAVEMRRSGGRYDTLYRTVASSCTICAENPTPTWALRATRITRDGILQVSSQRHRSQSANREAAVERFAELLRENLREEPPRRKTRPSRAAKARRLDEKRRQSHRKRERSTPVE